MKNGLQFGFPPRLLSRTLEKQEKPTCRIKIGGRAFCMEMGRRIDAATAFHRIPIKSKIPASCDLSRETRVSRLGVFDGAAQSKLCRDSNPLGRRCRRGIFARLRP